jgi:hypothetical protein
LSPSPGSDEVRPRTSGPRTTLPTTLPPNGRFPLSLPLSTGLLVEAPLPQLRIETGTLHLPLEPAKSPIEAFVVLDDNFQTDHAPFRRLIDEKLLKLGEIDLSINPFG